MKRIVLCADGTWNNRDHLIDTKTNRRHPTNVTKLARAVLPTASDGTHQVVYYLEGLGIKEQDEGFSRYYLNAATGQGLKANVRNLYRFLLYNYSPGDELYFFGFSRGAYTVRTLAGFMNYAGLVPKDSDYFVPELYRCYDFRVQEGSLEWNRVFSKVGQRGTSPEIKLIGVWDTVGALQDAAHHDVGLNDSIKHAYQALAIDERRVAFKPELWQRPEGWTGDLEQAWFAGAHANVGGSYNPDGLANEALHWMCERAEGLGLELDWEYLSHYRPCFDSWSNDEAKTWDWLWGYHTRSIAQRSDTCETLHPSVMDRMGLAQSDFCPDSKCDRLEQRKYAPKNLVEVIDRLKLSRTERRKDAQACGPWRLRPR